MKGLYIAGGICITVGIIVMITAFSLTGFNISKLRTEEELERKIEVIENVAGIGKIHFYGIDEDVEVIASDREDIEITYMDTKKSRYEITNRDGVLSIERKKRFQWFNINIFNIFGKSSKIVIQVPKKQFEDLSIDLVSGDIELRDLEVNRCKVKTVSSDIRVADHKGELLEIKAVSGDIDLRNVNTLDHRYKTVSGGIEGRLKGKRENYRVSISKVSGDSNIGEGGNLSAERNLSIDVVSGDIQIEFYGES